MKFKELLKTFMEGTKGGFLSIAKALSDETDPAKAVEEASKVLTKTVEDLDEQLENLDKVEEDEVPGEGEGEEKPTPEEGAEEGEEGGEEGEGDGEGEPEEIEKKVNALVEKAITKYADMYVSADSLGELMKDLKTFLGGEITKVTEAVSANATAIQKVSKAHTSKQVHKTSEEAEEGKEGTFGRILG
jgi:hypothetical protein